MIPAEFHFLRPWWLLALPALVLWLRYRPRRRASGWDALCDARLAPHVLAVARTGQDRLHAWTLPTAALLAVLALAGPAWERTPLPVFRDTAALVILLDLSRSMDAADVSPSRLTRARFKIDDILQRRRSGLTALVVYAGAAFTVTPLTDDARNILAQLPVLATDLMPVAGSRADLAIDRAADLLRQAGVRGGDVLLVTDGVTPDERVAALRAIDRGNLRLSVLAVGTDAGAPIPDGRGGFLADARGTPALARLPRDALAQLARRGGGAFLVAGPDDRDRDALLALFDRAAGAGAGEATTLRADQWLERGPWLVLLALPLAAAGFRRGWLMLAAAVILPGVSPDAQALDWASWWRRPDQQAYRAFVDREPARAATLFEDPAWKAAAQYRAGDFADAARNAARAPGADYNRGNALARLGRYDEAIAAYEAALKRNPDDADARHNLELLRSQAPPAPESGAGDGDDDASQPGDDSTSGGQAKAPGADPAAPHPGHPRGADDAQSGSAARPGQDADPDPDAPEPTAPERESASAAPDTPPARQPGAQDDATAQSARASESLAPDAHAPPRDEQAQAREAMLRRIPDDPGGLLRRKFQHQAQKYRNEPEPAQPW